MSMGSSLPPTLTKEEREHIAAFIQSNPQVARASGLTRLWVAYKIQEEELRVLHNKRKALPPGNTPKKRTIPGK